MDAKVFLIGSGRLDHISDPLANECTVVTSQDIFQPSTNPGHKLTALYRYIKNNNCIVVSDLLNRKALLAGLIAKRYNSKFLIRPRGTVIGEFEDRRRFLSVSRKKVSVLKMRAIRNKIFQLSDGVIAPSKFVKNLIIYSNLKDPIDVEVAYISYNENILNGAGNNGFKDLIGVPQDDFLLTSVTGFSYKQKYAGLVDYASAVDTALQKFNNLHFVIVGGTKFPVGDQEEIYQKEAEKEIRAGFSPDVQSRLHFPGHVENIENVYSSSDIFIHLSYRDSLAKVVMEAELFELPVIVNSGGGMPELLPNNPNAANAITDSGEEITHTIEHLVQNEVSRTETGEINRTWVQQRFCKEKIGEELYEAICKLVN